MERESMPLLLLEAFAFFAVLGVTSPLVHSAATNGVLGVLQPSRRRHYVNTERHIILKQYKINALYIRLF